MHDGAGELLDAAVAAFGALPGWRADALKGALTAVGARRDLAPRAAQAPVRVAVTGRAVGLPSFESLEVPGRERTLARLRAARVRLP
jgi:glutamyl-tRNA synthetase